MGLLDYSNLFCDYLDSLSHGWTFLNTSVSEFIDTALNVGFINSVITKPIIQSLISLSGYPDITWLGFIIYFMGTGLGVFLLYSLVVWILNLIT